MMILEAVEDNFVVTVLNIVIKVFMITIKAIRSAKARNEIWRFCAEH